MDSAHLQDIFQNGFTGNLRRVYVPVSRVIAAENVFGADVLCGNKLIHIATANDRSSCRVSKGGFLILDFGRELAGGVRILTGDGVPADVRIRFGESVSECCGKPDGDHAIHDAVITLPKWSAADFGATGFRFVRIDAVSDEVNLYNVIALADICSHPQTGVFNSSDELLNTIYDTAVHTVRLNIQEHIFDGIKRDRLIWGGDMHPEISVILRTFGAIPEIDASLEELCFHTDKGRFINNLSSYPLWVLWCIRDLWFYSGRREVPVKYRDFIVGESSKIIGYISDDNVLEMPGKRFLDWPTSPNAPAVDAGLHALAILALKAAQEMLSELEMDTEHISSAISRLMERVPDPNGNKSAAALLTLSGAADCTDVLENSPFEGVSTFLGYYVIDAKENLSALELIKRYWGGMIKMGATSFWEDFDLGWCENAFRIDEMPVPGKKDIHADFGNYCYKGLRHSLCHGWAAGPAAWCSRKILGVSPAAPGFSKITFAPDLCQLEYASGTIPTPHGEISVKLQKGAEPEITLPPQVEIVK